MRSVLLVMRGAFWGSFAFCDELVQVRSRYSEFVLLFSFCIFVQSSRGKMAGHRRVGSM